jgi:hypothetical protein
MMRRFFLLLATMLKTTTFEKGLTYTFLSISDTGRSAWLPTVAFVLFSICGEEFFAPKDVNFVRGIFP